MNDLVPVKNKEPITIDAYVTRYHYWDKNVHHSSTSGICISNYDPVFGINHDFANSRLVWREKL